MRQVTINEAALELTELVQATLSGEEVFITYKDKPVIKFVTIDDAPRLPRFGSGKDLIISMTDDFDTPLDDFAGYMG